MKKTLRKESTWYEVWTRTGKGGGLAEAFKTQQEAYTAMMETVKEEKEHGYFPIDYVIVKVERGDERTEDNWFSLYYEKVTALFAYDHVDGTVKPMFGK